MTNTWCLDDKFKIIYTIYNVVYPYKLMKIFPSYKFIHKSLNQFSFKDILYMLYSFSPCLASTRTTLNNVLLLRFYVTCTKNKIQYILCFLLSCFASIKTTFNICFVFVILSYIHKNGIQHMVWTRNFKQEITPWIHIKQKLSKKETKGNKIFFCKKF